MAKFNAELPNDVIKFIQYVEGGDVTERMVKAGAKVVYDNVKKNMSRAFKSTKSLEKGLKMTKVYKTSSDDGINVHIGFYGFDEEHKTKQYPNGIPIPLKAMAREYGTSRGEQKKPFFRKSFNSKQINDAITDVYVEARNKYIKGD